MLPSRKQIVSSVFRLRLWHLCVRLSYSLYAPRRTHFRDLYNPIYFHDPLTQLFTALFCIASLAMNIAVEFCAVAVPLLLLLIATHTN